MLVNVNLVMMALCFCGCMSIRKAKYERAVNTYVMESYHHGAYCGGVWLLSEYRNQPELAGKVFIDVYRNEKCPFARAMIIDAALNYGFDQDRSAIHPVISISCMDKHTVVRRHTLDKLVWEDGKSAVPLLEGVLTSLNVWEENSHHTEIGTIEGIRNDINIAVCAAANDEHEIKWEGWDTEDEMHLLCKHWPSGGNGIMKSEKRIEIEPAD